jgi:hypothetical protein
MNIDQNHKVQMKRQNKHPRVQINEKPEQTAAQPKPPAPTPEQIQKRAYEIYETRGGAPGREWDDWFLAEIELKSGIGLRRDSAG